MPLPLPDVDEYRIHVRRAPNPPYTSAESEFIEDSIQRAADLFRMATGLADLPEGPDDDPEFPLRVYTQGVLAMAQYIEVRSGEDSEAFYSPFSSERLGSYSYSKLVQAAQSRENTGVPIFDAAVSYFLAGDNAASLIKLTTEHVFSQPYEEYRADTYAMPDPSMTILGGP